MAAALKTEHNLSPPELIEQIIKGSALHICQTNGCHFAKEMQTAALLTKNPEIFFKSPCTAILWPSQAGKKREKDVLMFNYKIRSSTKKQELIEEMKKHAEKLTKSMTLLDEIVGIADEMVTNALFNAPFVDPVTHVNQRVDRIKTIVDLPESKAARLFFAVDEERIVIGIQDPFGSLDVPSYLSRISKCYTQGVENSINFEQGGAGIGSYIIFNTGSSLYLGVKPGRMTVLVSVVPYNLSRRQRDTLPKHLHWIKK